MDRSRDLGLPLGASVSVGGGCDVCIEAEEGNACRSPTCCPIDACGEEDPRATWAHAQVTRHAATNPTARALVGLAHLATFMGAKTPHWL